VNPAPDSVALREALNLRVDESPVAIVLGSGLGGISGVLEQSRSVSYETIPGFPPATVPGHAGWLHCGTVEGRTVLILAGRPHLYEGHPPAAMGQMIRVLAELGVRRMLLTNAAGGIATGLTAGSIAVVVDHINLPWSNPQTGPVVGRDSRFTDMAQPYDRVMIAALQAAAREEGINLAEAVYAGVTGPSYETAAEIRMLRRLGADVVGMSTVTEVIAARSQGIRCAAISCVTNRAAGLDAESLSHAAVLAAAGKMEAQVKALIAAWLRRTSPRAH
jgi:purine-nucleoside phosphorylase